MIDTKAIDILVREFGNLYDMNSLALVGGMTSSIDRNIVHQGVYSTWLGHIEAWRTKALNILNLKAREGFMLIHSNVSDMGLDEVVQQRLRSAVQDAYEEAWQGISMRVGNDAVTVKRDMRNLRLRLGMGGQIAVSALLGMQAHWKSIPDMRQTDALNRKYRSSDLAMRGLRASLMDTYVATKAAAFAAQGYDRVRVIDPNNPESNEIMPLANVSEIFHSFTKMDFAPHKD